MTNSEAAPLLEVRDVKVNYGRIEALHGVSLVVRQGELVTLLGSNGAGKTTLMRAISGLRPLSAGSIWFDGRDITKVKAHLRAIDGLVQAPEGRGVFPGMTVTENLEMGCYGIGISRLVAAAIEQNHDVNGIIWPISIAPFEVLLLPINYKDSRIREAADTLYASLQENGIDVLLDDRDERPGVKFKDADLVGIPLRVTIGPKTLEKGRVELRRRREGETEEVARDEVINKINSIISQALQV